MKLTPVRSLKDYDGPKNHKAIIHKIQEDARNENNVELPYSYIENMVTLFFSYNGINHYFRKFQSFAVPMLGRWSVNSLGRKAKKKKARYKILSKRKSMRIYCRKYRKRQRMLKKIAAKEALAASKRVSLK